MSRGPSIFLDKSGTYLGRSKGLCSQGNSGQIWGIILFYLKFPTLPGAFDCRIYDQLPSVDVLIIIIFNNH